eukprot:TRINITY_DN67170_c0_g1_i1.p1 TRINITY_DN67170_c0_g1~~TRINITY_DN67170_c0_g1_i1.p1  ORF type:complete len:349 (+),score=59.14 TRINITY_DN67170_c0_g1_i1:105-1151(+)
MPSAARLSEDGLPAPVANYLDIDALFALATASGHCRRICRQAACAVDVQALGGKSSGSTLKRIAHSSLTDRGASIRELRAVFCKGLAPEVWQALPKLPSLQILNLDGSQDVDDSGLVAIAQRCQHLVSVSLYWNPRVSDRGLCRLLRAQQSTSLTSISFSGVKYLGDETVQRIVSRGPQVEVLDLTRCPQVTDPMVPLVCECLDRLRIFRLYAMAQLSPAAFSALHHLTQLEELELTGCRLEDAPLEKLLEASKPSKLHTLNLTWCGALTDASALAVARCCPQMLWLSFFGNLNISREAIDALAAAPCGTVLRSLDVRGLVKLGDLATCDVSRLKPLFPALTCAELHH